MQIQFSLLITDRFKAESMPANSYAQIATLATQQELDE